uniref:Glutaredoxin-2, mitochondrial n=1 Tax=Panagrellus redivivus TaxID=6233 RepID=A0A7E4V3L4_PANRE
MITLINYLGYRKRMLRVSLIRAVRSIATASSPTSPSPREVDMSVAKTFVDGILKQYKVAVFSKTYCPYCTKAKTALEGFKLRPDAYYVVELDKRDDCNDIQDYLQTITGARSVPRVFINGKFFGGGDDTAAGAQNGLLEKKLAEAGAI